MTSPGKRSGDAKLHEVVLDDFRRFDLHRSIPRDLRSMARFYLSDEQQARLEQMEGLRAAFWRVAWLLKAMVLSLSPGRRLLLVLSIVFSLFQTSFDLSQTTSFALSTRWIGFAGIFLLLMLELKDKLVARDEIEVARQVQLSLLPAGEPDVAGWSLWGTSRPANDVGGDLLDYLPLEGQHWGIVLGDVAGKGMGAALLAAKLQATLRALELGNLPLDELGRRLNTILHRDGLVNRFATLFYCELDPASNRVRYLNAGHNPALVIGVERQRTLEASSYPLGMFPDADYAEGAVDLAPGELLVAYSDGLTEAVDAADEEFGEQRLRDAVRRAGGGSPAAIGRRVLAEVDRFVGDERPTDDLSLVVLTRSRETGLN